MSEDDFELLAARLSCLATERRLLVLRILLDSSEALSSGTIAAVTGLTEARTSFNLMRLQEAQLVLRIPSGRMVFYAINRKAIEMIQSFFVKQGETNESR